MPKKIDITGQAFGRLTVIKEGEPHILPSGAKRTKWLCECSCGKETLVTTMSLRSGSAKSCGCLQKEKVKEILTSHGMSRSPEYTTWVNIKKRCYDKKSISYPNYGDRGIKVCDRWLESFENFYEDMGSRPSENHSIERLDSDSDYCTENCIWVENEKQNRNQRLQSNNTSGVTGVSLFKRGNSWKASWNDLRTGKQKSKSFSVNKHGYDEAFRLACEYREKIVQELNEQGAGYSENHGK